MALVRFLIEDHDSASDNEFVAQYTLPFSSLQMGKSVSGGHKRASVFALQKRASAGTEGPLQPPHKGFFVCSISPRFCSPTQDTDTCLCWTRTGTFCPQLVSSCTSWSWTPSETPPSADWLFYLLLNGCFSPFLLLLFFAAQ